MKNLRESKRDGERKDRRGGLISPNPTISDAKVDVVLQRIEELIGDEIKVIPEHVKRYGVNNIFQRCFSYLFGWKSDGKPVKLAATIAGALKIASVGAGLEKTEWKTGVATETLSSGIAFSQIISRVEVACEGYDMYIMPSPDGVTFYDGIRCFANQRNSFDIAMHSFKVLKAGLNDVEYEITGVW